MELPCASTPRMTRKSSMSADERQLAIQEAVKKDRTARSAKFPANAAWFCQRVTILAALLLVLPLLAGALARASAGSSSCSNSSS